MMNNISPLVIRHSRRSALALLCAAPTVLRAENKTTAVEEFYHGQRGRRLYFGQPKVVFEANVKNKYSAELARCFKGALEVMIASFANATEIQVHSLKRAPQFGALSGKLYRDVVSGMNYAPIDASYVRKAEEDQVFKSCVGYLSAIIQTVEMEVEPLFHGPSSQQVLLFDPGSIVIVFSEDLCIGIFFVSISQRRITISHPDITRLHEFGRLEIPVPLPLGLAFGEKV